MTTTTNPTINVVTESLVEAWRMLRNDAGYGAHVGAGVIQSANNVATIMAMFEHMDDGPELSNGVAVGMVAGFLATSLANAFDTMDVAMDVVDTVIVTTGWITR